MKKHHAKIKQHKNSKNKYLRVFKKKIKVNKEKLLIIGIMLGILILGALSAYLLLNRGEDSETLTELGVSPTPEKRVLTPYPTIPEKITNTTILINRRAIIPASVTIISGGSVSFYNEDSLPITINGFDGLSSILNIGEIGPQEIVSIDFTNPGVYKYVNPQRPQDVAEIVVEE